MLHLRRVVYAQAAREVIYLVPDAGVRTRSRVESEGRPVLVKGHGSPRTEKHGWRHWPGAAPLPTRRQKFDRVPEALPDPPPPPDPGPVRVSIDLPVWGALGGAAKAALRGAAHPAVWCKAPGAFALDQPLRRGLVLDHLRIVAARHRVPLVEEPVVVATEGDHHVQA